MRKFMLFFAACVALVACKKEQMTKGTPFQAGQVVTIGVSAENNSASKVSGTDDGSNINFKWENDDEIKVVVNGQSATFDLTSGAGTNKATFTGIMPSAGNTFDVYYPATTVDLSNQNYESGKISTVMSFSAIGCTLDKSANLQAATSILKLNFTGTQIIGKIVVETVDASPAKSYTLNIDEIVILSSTAQSFYIVTDKINAKLKVSVYNPTDPEPICSFTTSGTIDLSSGNCVNMPVKVVGDAPSILLPGVFSVSSSKTVNFTRGNLYYSTSDNAYHIEAAQNVTELGPSNYNSTHVCLFYWSNSTQWQTSGTEPWTSSFAWWDASLATSDKFFCGEDNGNNGMTVDGQSGLYALSKDEWEYLIFTRPNASNLKKKNVSVTTSAGTVNGCFIIAPDGYSGTIADSYTAAEWATAEASGLVCIPAAGYRWVDYGVEIYKIDTNEGCMQLWTATPSSSEPYNAYYIEFSYLGNKEEETGETCRWSGYSIRLVSTAE